MNLNNPVRAVAWNHSKSNILAAGLFSGDIVIIDVEKYQVKQVLTGSSDKILALKWHPVFDYILASGSSDQMVRVWDIKNVSPYCLFIPFPREWAQKLRVPQITSTFSLLEL